VPIASGKTLHDELQRSVSSDLAAAIQEPSNQYSSHEILQLIFWNVIIGFIVNVVAGASTPALIEAFKKKGRVTRKDIDEHKKELSAPIVIPASADLTRVKGDVTAMLMQFGLTRTAADSVSEKVTEVLLRNTPQGRA
jgi:hypothetical protein